MMAQQKEKIATVEQKTMEKRMIQPLTAETLWKLGRINIDAVSPEGKIIYGDSRYSVENNKSSRDLYLIDAEGKISKLTETEESEMALFFLSETEFAFSKKGKLYRYNLTDKSISEYSDKEIENLQVANNQVVFTKSVKVEKVSGTDYYPELEKSDVKIYDDLMYRQWDTWKDGNFPHVFVADNLNTIDNALDINKDEPYEVSDFKLHPSGKSLVYVAKKETGKVAAQSTNSNLYLYDIEKKTTQNLSEDNQGYDTHPAFNAEGSKLAYLQMKTPGYEADKNELIVLDLATGQKKNITQNWDYTIDDFVWSKDAKKIYAIAPIKATQQIVEIELQSQKIKILTQGQHDYVSLYVAGNALVGGRQDINHATEIFKIDPKSGSQTQISKANDDLNATIAQSKVEERWVTTTDGKKMLVWVVFPPNFDASKKYPTLLYCQGGPQSAVSQFYSFRWNFQIMAAQGYIVVAPNRRGLPSFGTEWNHAISKDWGGQAIQDYLSAIDDVSKESYVDKTRLGAVGASYGGYSVYYLAGVHNKRFKTFIAHCGLFDMTSWYGTTEELFFANYDLGGAYWDEKARKTYEQFNPIKLVDKWDTPIMVIHGGKDYRVPYSQGMEAFQAAQLKGVKSRFMYFPEENHWVLSPQNAIIWQREFFRWLKETLE